MADEIAKRDQNSVPVLMGITDDSSQEIRMLRVDPITGALLVTGSGFGDVEGPGSSTDNAIPRFDGTTGKIIQNSGVIIDDSNIVYLPGSVSGTVGLSAPSSPTSYVLTLPTNDGGPNQFLQTDGSGVTTWASVTAGDVTGPASSTDNAITRFDGTTGKIIQNSAVTIDDTGRMVGPTYILDAYTLYLGDSFRIIGNALSTDFPPYIYSDNTNFDMTPNGVGGFRMSTNKLAGMNPGLIGGPGLGRTFEADSAIGVSSPNLAAGDLIASSGSSTGTGTGKVVVKTTPAGTAGTGTNTPVTAATFDSQANFYTVGLSSNPMEPTGNVSVPSLYSCVIADHLTIAAGKTLTIGVGAYLSII